MHIPAFFPDQNFQRKVNGDTGTGQHERCASFGTAEYQQLGGTHFHSHLFCFSTVVHYRKQRDSLGLENVLELFYVSSTE